MIVMLMLLVLLGGLVVDYNVIVAKIPVKELFEFKMN